MLNNFFKRTISLSCVCSAAIILLFGGLLFAAERPIVFVDHSWDSIQLHNRIAGFILEHGYGRKVDYVFAESMPGLMGLERGDIDVLMETWAENVLEWWYRVQKNGRVLNLGRNYPDAPQGWYVPTYVIKGDPERGIEPIAPDLRSVMDLPKYWNLFKDIERPDRGRLYNGPAGWKCNSINTQKLKVYGLDDKFTAFDPGSQTALATAIARAYEKGDPILAYYWEPTAIMGKYDMTKLEEPPFDRAIWEKDHSCAFPATKVLITINTKFAKENPAVVDFLKNYSTTLGQNNAALAYMKEENVDSEKGALWFLRKYRKDWKSWMNDETAQRVERALEKERK